jgi:YebC/PmpR family DNA-binding regulatory protein
MSGHSKWSTIKRQKGANDARRGQAFTKAGRLITIAAREGGGNPTTNFKLRLAIEAARAINMPKDNIERAILRATGGGDAGNKQLEEVLYEGYGPNGVALLIEVVTDNKMRTASEIRSLLERAGGSLSGPGSVAFLFKSQGLIEVSLQGKNADELLLTAADSGADDVEAEEEVAYVYTKPEMMEEIKEKLVEQGYTINSSEVIKQSTTTSKITSEQEAQKVLNLIEKLEELEDVQKVYANFDIPSDIIERVA